MRLRPSAPWEAGGQAVRQAVKQAVRRPGRRAGRQLGRQPVEAVGALGGGRAGRQDTAEDPVRQAVTHPARQAVRGHTL